MSFTIIGLETIEQEIAEKAEAAERGNYKDGVYTGQGEGFRGTTQVQVTVEDGFIADIAVLSFQDDREFFQKAQSSVVGGILTEQTPDVDAVSGATFSSKSIMEAVADALESGLGEPEQPADNRKEDAADGSVEPDGKPEQHAGGEYGSEAGHPEAGEGKGHGPGRSGNGRHGRGRRGGSGGDGHRGGWN